MAAPTEDASVWREFYKRCEHATSAYDGYRFVPVSTAVLLDQFERATGLPLPTSYRQFVTLFGPGELAGLYRIAAPLPFPHEYDLGTFNRQLHGEPGERLLETFGPPEATGKFMFFGASGGGEFFGWKTDEVTDRDGHEYAVYRFDFPPAERVAGCFGSWVRDYVMRADPSRGWTPDATFCRFQIEA